MSPVVLRSCISKPGWAAPDPGANPGGCAGHDGHQRYPKRDQGRLDNRRRHRSRSRRPLVGTARIPLHRCRQEQADVHRHHSGFFDVARRFQLFQSLPRRPRRAELQLQCACGGEVLSASRSPSKPIASKAVTFKPWAHARGFCHAKEPMAEIEGKMPFRTAGAAGTLSGVQPTFGESSCPRRFRSGSSCFHA